MKQVRAMRKQVGAKRIFSLLFSVAALFSAVAMPASARAQAVEFEVNGLKVIVKQRPATRTVAGGLFVRGGAAELTPENAGIEALLLNVMSEASLHFPRATLRSELARTGSTLSYSVSRDYSVVTLGSTRESFDRTWTIFADVVLHPSILPADVERMKNVMIASARGRGDSPDGLLEELQSAGLKPHPYYLDPHGTPETLARFTPDDLRAWHRKIMQTSRLLLVLVGDLDIYTVRARVAAAFGQMPVGNYKAPEMPLLTFSQPTVNVTARDLPTNYVQGIFGGPASRSSDYPALAIATSILRDRVYNEVRLRRNLSYAPNAFLDQRAASSGGIYVTAVDANQSVQLMLQEISRLQNELVDADTLTAITAQFATTTYQSSESSIAQVGSLGIYELNGGGWRNAETLLARLKAVKAVDVQRVCRQYMRNLQFVVIGNPAAVDRAVFLGKGQAAGKF